ncbi:MAG: hypothetical protein HIU93_12660 [Acidobacteria bacterium]|nr:hypothetical protein [Acidobacteriota bacterium]
MKFTRQIEGRIRRQDGDTALSGARSNVRSTGAVWRSQPAGRSVVAGFVLAAVSFTSLPLYGLGAEAGQGGPAANAAAQTTTPTTPTTAAQPATATPTAPPSAPAETNTKKTSRRQQSRQHAKDRRDAETAYLDGAKLLEQRDIAGAEQAFTKASLLAPENQDYLLAAAAMRESQVTELVQQAGKDRLLGKDAEAEGLLAKVRALDPNNSILAEHSDPASLLKQMSMNDEGSVAKHSWIAEGPRLSGPIDLQPSTGVHSFHLTSDLQDTVRQVALAYGIKVSFDDSVGHSRVKFDLDDVTYEQAMHVLLGMGPLFAVPLNRTTIIVAKDTEEKRSQFDHLIEETIYLPGDSTAQITELGNMIRNVFEVKQISVENNLQTIAIRAPNETIRVLNMTLADLLDGGSQVYFDLKLYAIDKSLTRSLGATVPNNVGLYNVASAANQLVQANQQVVDQAIAQGLIPANLSNIAIAAALIYYGLATSPLLSGTLAFVGNGLTATGIFSSNLSAQINLALSESETRALDDIQIRVGDREQAVFRVGSKYPITQSTYSTTTSTTSSGQSGATIGGVSVSSLLSAATTSTIPQIQYEDLGLTLKATPVVQLSGQVTLHLDLKIEALQGTSLDGIPVLTDTSFTSDVTVADGATATLVTNLTTNEASAVTGIPGLSDLPGFQSAPDLLRTTDRSQLVMLLTPHIVRRRRDRNAGPQIPISVPATVE